MPISLPWKSNKPISLPWRSNKPISLPWRSNKLKSSIRNKGTSCDTICGTCDRVFSTDIFTVPESCLTRSSFLDTPGGGDMAGGTDDKIYFVAHKSSFPELTKSARSCACCAWLIKTCRDDMRLGRLDRDDMPTGLGFWLLREGFGVFNCVFDYQAPVFQLGNERAVPYEVLEPRYGSFEIVAAHGKPKNHRAKSSKALLTSPSNCVV